jgi:hypothetical protein
MKGEEEKKVMRTEMRNSGRHVGRKVEEECTDKKKTKFSSYIRKSRREQLQSLIL